MFFRAGRNVFIKELGIKKYFIQKYISKKISHLVKKPLISNLNQCYMNVILLQCNLFYSLEDSTQFINKFGVLINNNMSYRSQDTLEPNHIFMLIHHKTIFQYIKKKKKQVILNFKKIKMYKFRSKYFLTKYKNEWMPNKNWLAEHSFIYFSKFTNLEFDSKIMTGVLLYNISMIALIHPKYINTSLYMTRSYNWKYLT